MFKRKANSAAAGSGGVTSAGVPWSASPPLTDRHQYYRMTRRSIVIGAAAALICAPAIVRATSLMRISGLPLQFLNPLGEFYRRCFYHSLESDLRAGSNMSTVIDGQIVSVVEGRPDGRACSGTGMAVTGSRL